MNRSDGIFHWFRLFAMLSIFFTYVWFWGWGGLVPGVLVAIAAAIAGDVFREVYCTIAVHPKGIYGYNASSEHLRKYNMDGPAAHKVARNFWAYKWKDFLYSERDNRWSWRPYAMLVAFALICYLSPLLCVSLMILSFSIALNVAMSGASVPSSLFLGSSSPETHRVLTKIGRISGIKWVSLLRDAIPIEDEPSKFDAQMYMLDIAASPNIWSLRVEESADWREVVIDFIRGSAIIVLWPDINEAVQEEIDILSRVEHLGQIIVIRTDSEVEERLPEPLHKCLMSEQEAMDLIALTASNPRLFRRRLWGRFDVASIR